ncbi:unnamed protein product [Rhizophagus irregularis]|uniref:Uncharacterized protein n=1 Tax=Rhizophagus irregularis TaxID=588596 RepID=A0A915YQY3_9GLOM|nr:unnamed protein product [Rhizophagus irregularis]
MDPLNDTTRYPITLQPSQPSLITHHRKEQENAEEQVKENDFRQQKKARSEEKKTNIEEIRTLIKEQTDTIAEIMKEQYIHASEVQQKQHNEQMELFKMFLMKF